MVSGPLPCTCPIPLPASESRLLWFCRPGEIFCFNSTEEHDAFFNGTIELTGIEYTGNFTNAADVEALYSQASIMQQKYKELGEKCLNGPSGKYLRYVGAAATVRDLVALSDALDGPDQPVNYIGTSYGTLLGSWFVNSTSSPFGHFL